MAAKFSPVVLGVLIFVAIAATVCSAASAGLTEFGPTYHVSTIATKPAGVQITPMEAIATQDPAVVCGRLIVSER
uniref:Uncharacterized protein n=1 Tax=Leersia perrieri TaxID=77586 RepID=A0A0D9XUP4_9ORYZ